jgi:flagellin
MSSFGDYNRVNTNVTAMDAQLSLNKINKDLGESRLKLSTGFKINNAEDDAAGFAIATKLKSRVAGLEQALQNVSDAKSVLGVAEGAYNSILDNLIEMKSLSTQASNGTLGQSERAYIGSQISALADDINDVADSTTFNGVDLANASASTLTFQVGEGTSDTYDVALTNVNMIGLFGTLGTNDSTVTNGQILGATSGGGNPSEPNNNGTTTAAEQHWVNIYDADQAEDSSGTATAAGAGTSIYLRDAASPAASLGKLYIDSESVNAADMRAFMGHVDSAISTMNGKLNTLGISQSSLSGKEVNLTEAITANSAARSRIMDTDFAKEQSNSIRLQILQQTATAALSQANMGPQAVLGFLG